MEFANAELAVLEQVVVANNEGSEMVELAEIQLALVGGGVGEVILA